MKLFIVSALAFATAQSLSVDINAPARKFSSVVNAKQTADASLFSLFNAGHSVLR